VETIKFELSGAEATFKKPYINNMNLTYSHIHKIALLGMLGAILGLEGHEQEEKEDIYPEFYEKLKGLKVSILPHTPFIPKTIKDVTDTNGFSNKGETFVTREQALVNPKWTIYVQKGETNDILYGKLKEMLLKEWAKYSPYLGRNHYQATRENAEIINLKAIDLEDVNKIDSLIKEKDFEFVEDFSLEENVFETGEYYPTKYRPYVNYYIEEKMYLTNKVIEVKEGNSIYVDKNRYLYFF
jgi:CRISPR-associated protein Cas5h